VAEGGAGGGSLNMGYNGPEPKKRAGPIPPPPPPPPPLFRRDRESIPVANRDSEDTSGVKSLVSLMWLGWLFGAGYGWIRPSPPPRPLDPEWVVSALVTLGWMAALVLACLAISR
jgi:hypothetical protein